MLKFSLGNAKLRKGEAIFDLPAGHTCPFAHQCKAKANRVTGKITDGNATQFRCYAASVENYRTNVRKMRWRNFDHLRGRSVAQMVMILESAMPDTLRYRIHSSGDFFSQDYFDAWLTIARKYPERIFYAYTKALPYWVKRIAELPSNFRLIASRGGTHDHLIEKYGLKTATVVFSEDEAKRLGLLIDFDDRLAWSGQSNFALLLHGTQPPKTLAAKMWYQIRKFGKGGYSRRSN